MTTSRRRPDPGTLARRVSPGWNARLAGAGRRTRRVGTPDSRVWGRVAPPLVLVAVGLVAWQWYVTAAEVRPQVLPSPSRVLEQGWAFREQIWANTVPTLQVTAVGFTVSLVLAWVLAIAVDFSPWLRRALMPLL